MNYFKSHIDVVSPNHPVPFTSTHGTQSSTLADVVASVPEFKKGLSFWLSPFFSSGHVQTAYTALKTFENIDHIHYKRRLLTVEDVKYKVGLSELPYDRWKGESTFTIDYVVKETGNSDEFRPESQKNPLPPRTEYLDPAEEHKLLADESRPLVIACHGLTGGSYEAYIRSFLTQITNEPYSFDAVVLNSRGCANHTITSPQLFCGLWTNDLRYLVNEHILKLWPNKRIYLIGYSLGGAIVANYLGQEHDLVPSNIKGAMVVASPWSFTDSSYRLSESLLGNHVYSPAMCKNLLRLLNKHVDGHLKHDDNVVKYMNNPLSFNIVKLRDFDDNFTSRLFGFNCADEYYRHASPSQRLYKIRVPTVILNAKDDPVSSFKSVPLSDIALNPYTLLVSTTIGGHIGWFDIRGNRWNSLPSAKFFKELDENWRVNNESAKENLPSDVNDVWQHDRLVY